VTKDSSYGGGSGGSGGGMLAPNAPWSASVAYGGGSCVSYQGAKYCAQWWTQGDVPSSGGVWVKS
jgi:chitodextrinase